MNIYDFFESVDILVDAKIKNLNLDRTILCEIVELPAYLGGRYGVMYENSKFYANAMDSTLQIGDLVYVGVPQNDYTNAFIMSKKIQEAGVQYQIDPCENFYSMIEYHQKSDEELILNKNKERYQQVTWELNDQTSLTIEDLNKYDYMSIEGCFQSTCTHNYQGTYGLKVYIKTQEVEGEDSYYNALHENTFSSDNMIMSNAYVYAGDSVQKCLYDIRNIDNIVGVTVGFYCDNTTFSLDEGLSESLIVKDIKIKFGFNLSSTEKPSLEIYVPMDDTFYGAPSLDVNPDKNKKTLYAKWIFQDNQELKAITYSNFDNLFHETGASIQWQKYINGTWQKVPTAQSHANKFICSDRLNIYKENERYRCKITYNTYDSEVPLEYISNILEFTNLEGVSYTDIIKKLEIAAEQSEFIDLYDSSGKIVDRTKALECHNIIATAEINRSSVEQLLSDNRYAIYVKWLFPLGEETMLTYPETLMSQVEDNILELKIGSSNYNNGKQLWEVDNNQLKLLLPFKLKEYYSPSCNQNTIQLEVAIKYDEDKYDEEEIVQFDTVSQELIFRKAGVCETDYVINFTMYNGSNAVVSAIKPGENVNILAELYDCNGKKIETLNGFTWSWYYQPQEVTNLLGYTLDNPNKDFLYLYNNNNTNICSIMASTELAEPLYDYYSYFDAFYILQAQYTIKDVATNKSIRTVIDYLPIAINNSHDAFFPIDNISGPTKITYNSLGSMPKFYSVPYQAYNSENEAVLFDWTSNIEGFEPDIVDLTEPSLTNLNKIQPYYPKIVKEYGHGFTLSAPSLYISNAATHYGILGYDMYNTPWSQDNESHIPSWIQPVMIYQTNSFSSFVNDWDGSFSIDEQNNQLLSARLGAGKKHSDGTFSGVLLGDWKPSVEDGSMDDELTGIYGISHGKQSYGFKEDGTAFLGQDTTGRIEFNGIKGTIQSALFDGEISSSGNVIDTGTTGSYWDLKTGTLITNNGYFRGKIEANEGEIGGWGITDTVLYQNGVGMHSGQTGINSPKKSPAYFIPLGQASGTANIGLFGGAYLTPSSVTAYYTITEDDYDETTDSYKCTCACDESLRETNLLIHNALQVHLSEKANQYYKIYPESDIFYDFEVNQFAYDQTLHVITFYLRSEKVAMTQYDLVGKQVRVQFEYIVFANTDEELNTAIKQAHFIVLSDGTTYADTLYSKDLIGATNITNNTQQSAWLNITSPFMKIIGEKGCQITVPRTTDKTLLDNSTSYGLRISTDQISVVNQSQFWKGHGASLTQAVVGYGVTGWARPEPHMFVYYINGICVGALDYSDKATVKNAKGETLYIISGTDTYQKDTETGDSLYWHRFINRAQTFYTSPIVRDITKDLRPRPAANNYPLGQTLYEVTPEYTTNNSGSAVITGYEYQVFEVIAQGLAAAGNYHHQWLDVTTTKAFAERVENGYAYGPRYLNYGTSLHRDRSYFEGKDVDTPQWICNDNRYGD